MSAERTPSIILDTDKALKCGSCQSVITGPSPKVIIGYGHLIITLHPDCWIIEALLRKELLLNESE